MNPKMSHDICAPHSTSEQDAIKGKWVRVDRDLNLEGGYMSPWLVRFYARPTYLGCSSELEYILPPNKEARYQPRH